MRATCDEIDTKQAGHDQPSAGLIAAAREMRATCDEIDPPEPGHQAPEPARTHRAAAAITTHRAWLAAIPITFVNSVAFFGQLGFLRTHLHWILPGQTLFGVTLESIAVYLAWQAHLAQLADDSAMRLRLAAYSAGLVIGACNYSHYAAPHWRPTFAAIGFGGLSAISPWLWSIHSRRTSRDDLMQRNRIEPHAVRLGPTRWTWHPLKSARVMWHATWIGENDPAAAIALAAAAELPEIGIDAAVLNQMTHKERLILAFGTVGELSVPKALAVLKDRGAAVDQSTAYQIRKALAPADNSNGDTP
jgi:hypothetical protein